MPSATTTSPETMEEKKESKATDLTTNHVDMTQVIFEGIYAKIVNMNSRLRMIVYPYQELEEKWIHFADNRTNIGEVETYWTVDIALSEDGKFFIAQSEPKKAKAPNKGDVEKKAEYVKGVMEKVKEMENALKEKAQKEFKDKNSIPPVPVGLYIDENTWNLACAAVKLDKYTLLLGPKGCGKTETAKQIAAALEMDFYPFNMGQATKPKEYFIGVMQARENKNGNVETILFESEFLKAYQAPKDKPTLIFLDELTRIPQSASNMLMQALDRNMNKIWVPELGRYVERGEGTKFISAGNAGMQYTDTRTLDGAFMDRFIKLTVDYLPEDKELKLIMERAPKANSKWVRELISRANKCRNEEKAGNLASAISTRQLIDMSHYMEAGFTLEEVFNTVFLNNFINGQINEIEMVKGIIQS